MEMNILMKIIDRRPAPLLGVSFEKLNTGAYFMWCSGLYRKSIDRSNPGGHGDATNQISGLACNINPQDLVWPVECELIILKNVETKN